MLVLTAVEKTDMATATESIPTTTTTSPSTIESFYVSIQHGKKSFDIALPVSSTIKTLKEKIQVETQIPPYLQKLMLKTVAKTTLLKDDNSTLESYGVKSKSKIMLIGSTIENVISATTSQPTADKKQEAKQVEEKTEGLSLSQQKEHQKVITKGVPEDAEKGVADKIEPLPKSIKGLVNKQGTKIRLTFKNDEQQLWIGSAENTEKYFYGQIRDVQSEPIHTNKEYHIMYFQIGNSPNNKYWIYWVPAQYCKAIKYTILGGGHSNVPLLH